MRIMIHGLLLYVANMVGIGGGFFVYKLAAQDQRTLQMPIAAVLSIVLFLLWCYFVRKILSQKIVDAPLDLIWIFAAAMAWGPLSFYPLHFFTQGYMSDSGNIIAMMLFQFPTNAVALFFTYVLTQST